MPFFKSIVIALLLFVSATVISAHETPRTPSMDQISERYVKLILAIGEHEPGYVDAYYGPKEWQSALKGNVPSLSLLKREAASLLTALKVQNSRDGSEAAKQRIRFLEKQLIAAEARVRMLEGEKFSFDQETQLLFDAVVPPVEESTLEASLAALDGLIEGEGELKDRIIAYREGFTVPTDKLESVFAAAINACRNRTAAQMALPEGETFTSEFVTGKPWSGYNWYQGGAVSLIQVNTDLPSLIDSAVNLGCHEGYPGHHVFNTMLESNLVNDKGWQEFSIYPLYSPQSLLAEGTASYARHMAFPGNSQADFEAAVLYPLAGLDPTRAQKYADTLKALNGLRYARIEGARRYLDGKISKKELVNWLVRYELTTVERAEKSVRFIEAYRGYVINYTLGSDLSKAYVDHHGGNNHKKRWQAYKVLLSTPLTASMLAE